MIESLSAYLRAANYLSAAQLYLCDNFLLQRPLKQSDIKPRLLGHWGTSPGINAVYAQLNHQIITRNLDILFILGPGHGFPALQANLFLEKTLQQYYPEASHDVSGISYLIKQFSWPYGFPSHSNPGTPGVILEGGELGYALGNAYGTVLDNPSLITACVIGDGESETGPTAAAWHLNKLVDPLNNGIVLPIVHVNEYKISGPTIYGRMSDEELFSLFYGYGYEPFIVAQKKDGYPLSDEEFIQNTITIFNQVFDSIQTIKNGNQSRLPVIIFKSMKGWTGIKELHGKKIEDNCLSHQVVAANARTNNSDLQALEKWLLSYKFNELFNEQNGFCPEIKQLVPPLERCMGMNHHAQGSVYKSRPLILPDPLIIQKQCALTFGPSKSKPEQCDKASSMLFTGEYLNAIFQVNKNTQNIRFFSPDETYSNKLDALFKTTDRAWIQEIKPWDQNMAPDGRSMEILSEHCLQGMLEGYIRTGRNGVFASYEAFITIITSMVDQYAKFLKTAAQVPWRKPLASLNYILTSSGWRQEHNGFSHQNPGFIDTIITKHPESAHVYFPPDGNSTLVCLKTCLESQNNINVIIAGKTVEPLWLTMAEAQQSLDDGLMIWNFASDPNPDIVLCGIGDYVTKEVLAAIMIIKNERPDIRIRFVNVVKLSTFCIGSLNCRTKVDHFNHYFTTDKPVIFNFHGYPQTLKLILFDYPGEHNRFSIRGYIENGSTTTPFDMHVRNKTSRYHLAIKVFKLMHSADKITEQEAESLIIKYTKKLSDHTLYIKKYGVDPEEIELWQWQTPSS